MMNNRWQPSRRTFLKAAASTVFAVPSIVPASARGADGATPPSERITLGFIGVGGQGNSNLNRFLEKADAQVLAVCDVDQKHGDAAKGRVDSHYGNTDCAQSGDFRELTGRSDIDAMVISTPDHWHVLTALDAVRQKKDVYVEKPLTWSIGEGRVLSDAVKKHGRILQTGSQQRSGDTFWKACMLARNGILGDIHQISVGIPDNNRECGPTWEPQPVPEGFDYDLWLGPAPWAEYHPLRCHYTFRFILDYSGGQVTNFGAHHLDIAQWALNMDTSGPVAVSGNGAFPDRGLFTTATKVYFECDYANGVKVICKTHGPSIQIEGSQGSIRATRKNISANPAMILDQDFGLFKDQLYLSRDHHENFLQCVKSREETICPAETGHRSATVCHLGNIAMRLGRPVKWDPAAENFGADEEADAMARPAMRDPWTLGERYRRRA